MCAFAGMSSFAVEPLGGVVTVDPQPEINPAATPEAAILKNSRRTNEDLLDMMTFPYEMRCKLSAIQHESNLDAIDVIHCQSDLACSGLSSRMASL